MFLLFSHSLTAEQKQDAITNLGVEEFVGLPENLQKIFSNIPAEAESIEEIIEPFYNWLEENAKRGDYVLIQGDFGVVFLTVNYAKSKGLIPVYATTERVAVEQKQEDGSVLVNKIFRHKRFRKY